MAIYRRKCITEETARLLLQARSCALSVQNLRLQLATLTEIQSVPLSDMPHSPNAPSRGLDLQVIRRQAICEQLEREERRLTLLQREAQKRLALMPQGICGFCMLYYLSGVTFYEATASGACSERQCYRIKAEVERLAVGEGGEG